MYYPRLDNLDVSTLVSLLRCTTCQILSQNDAWAIALHHSGNKYLNVTECRLCRNAGNKYLNVTECRLYMQTKTNPLTPKNFMQMILYHWEENFNTRYDYTITLALKQ